MFGNFSMAIPIAVLAVGGIDRLRDQEVRPHQRRRSERKVDSLGRSLEETQERTRQNEGKIAEVDQKAQAAAQAAAAAGTAAAGQHAQPARPRARPTPPTTQGRRESTRPAKRLVFEVVLSEDQGNFKFGKTELPDEAKAKLDEMITQIKADPKGAFFEIEGHTDNVGGKVINEQTRPRARRSREAVSLRAAPDSAAQDERHQLRRRQAGRAEQDQRRPRAEPPRRHQGARVTRFETDRQPSQGGRHSQVSFRPFFLPAVAAPFRPAPAF